jgi:excisionase family DNA binding protein
MEINSMSLKTQEAAKILNISRTAVQMAIKSKKLKARKEKNYYLIEKEDINDYIYNRFSRDKSYFGGELRYDSDKGEISIKNASKYSGIKGTHLYYAIKQGYLPVKRKGTSYVLYINDVNQYKMNLQKYKKRVSVQIA